ncbi:MAG: hypothetical protein IT514_09715 [Burkholderiales bacterium]|nr:hypothetical protein [Burkholderiales bacterium]
MVGVTCRGFTPPARLVARAEGLPAMRVLEYPPPNIGAMRKEEIHESSLARIDELIALLTRPLPQAPGAAKPASAAGHDPREIVFRGTLREVNERFHACVWSDGLPVVPPTLEEVDAFLAFTERAPGEVIARLPPARLPATVWKVAVNGVMAGCRPEYMPVLLAIADAVADPHFGIEHAGSTVGLTPLIILNGPIAKALGFNSGQGVLRPQAQANISVSRFLRLLMVNVAGYRLGESDMATFGRNYYPVLAEAEEESPWPPLCVDRGFPAGSNVVTVQSADSITHSFLTEGPAHSHLRVIAREVARELGGNLLVPMERFGGRVAPVLGITPLVAGILAKAGYTKDDVKRWVFEHALVPATQVDEQLARIEEGYCLKESVRRGRLPGRFALCDDPERLVPVLHEAAELQIVVCGAPNRNRSFICGQFGKYGWDTSREIRLPAHWRQALERRSG